MVPEFSRTIAILLRQKSVRVPNEPVPSNVKSEWRGLKSVSLLGGLFSNSMALRFRLRETKYTELLGETFV